MIVELSLLVCVFSFSLHEPLAHLIGLVLFLRCWILSLSLSLFLSSSDDRET